MSTRNHSAAPDPNPADCFCLGLRRATRAITKLYDDALKPCELKATQLSLLGHLVGRDSVGFAELTEALTMDQTTLTRNLRPLERRKLIAIRAGSDRRTRNISLTPAGESLLKEALPLWSAVQRAVMRKLGAERGKTLRGELCRVASEFNC